MAQSKHIFLAERKSEDVTNKIYCLRM